MIQHTPGKIFLADQRGLVATGRFRRYSTFSFGSYFHEHKGPFGRLYGFNEETMAPLYSLALPVSQDSYVLVLPITGAVELSIGAGAPVSVNVEEIRVLALPAGSQLRLANSYPQHLISFLHIWLSAELVIEEASQQHFTFDLAATGNQLTRVRGLAGAGGASFSLSIGRFAGRREAFYRVQNADSQVFAFALTGAFELQGRLLHEHDGLALWEAGEIELEALSNDAIILMLEW